MKLADCLAAQTWRGLQAISRANELGFDGNLTKTQARQRLAAWLGSDAHLRTIASLPAEGRAALRDLLAAGGQMAAETFTERFGPIRPHRPWRPEAPRAPWTEPRSVAEMLVYGGLVFPLTLGHAPHRRQAIVLPDEFHQPVAARLSPALPATLDVQPACPPSPLPLDLLTFLGYLQREHIRPIWGRWLPPTALRALNQLLTRPDDLSDVRSERQARRIPFLHYLAEAAGLLALSAGYLKPTLEAHRWLERPLAERITTLWNAWQQNTASNEVRWQAFRLPAWPAPQPTARFRRLARALASFPAGYALATDGWLAALSEVDPTLLRPTPSYDHWAHLGTHGRAEWEETLRLALADLLTGPLTWLGLFALAEDAPSRRLTFTSLGAALVGRDDGQWPADQPPKHLHIAPRPVEVEGTPAILCLRLSAVRQCSNSSVRRASWRAISKCGGGTQKPRRGCERGRFPPRAPADTRRPAPVP